jgi:hypothetical protein
MRPEGEISAKWADDRMKRNTGTKARREELEEHHEIRRLAEIAWAGMQANPHWTEYQPNEVAEEAWRQAEAMHGKNHQRRQQA